MKKTFFLILFFAITLTVFFNSPVASESHKINKFYKQVQGKSLDEKVSVIITFRDKKPSGRFRSALSAMNSKESVMADIKKSGGKIKHRYRTINAISSEVTVSELYNLLENPDVIIELNRKVHAFLQESVPLINADKVWDYSFNGTNFTGAGQTVCIIDTGVDYNHSDLGSCFGEGCKVVSGYDFVNSDSDPKDDNGHGTHVAGIAAANGSIKGVAPGAKIVAIKVLDSGGSGTDADVIAGMDWCISNSTKYNISVISMSLGTEPPLLYSSYCDNAFPSFTQLINSAIAKNISVVVATGNNGDSTAIASPACIQNATRVGATTKSDSVASFTNRGINFPDMLLAPGVDINSTLPGESYTSWDGTSMATPHVSGAIAILVQGYKTFFNTMPTPNSLTTTLNKTGKPINDSATSLNFSRINIQSAFIYAFPPIISFIPPTPENESFVYKNHTLINITVNENADAAILDWNGTNETMQGGDFNFYLNKTNLSDGNYSFVVYANDSSGNIGISEFRAVIIEEDTLLPTVYFIQPTPSDNYTTSDSNITINISHIDEHPDTLIFNWNGTESFYDYSGNYTNLTKTNISDGVYAYYVWLNDSAGNSNQTETRTITINANPQVINITSPENKTYNTTNIQINYSAEDLTLDSCWYFYNNSNVSLQGCANNSFVAIDNSQSTLFIYANDSLGRTASENVTFTVDTLPPNTTVQNASAVSQSDGSIFVSWDMDLNNDTIYYRFYRSNETINDTANATLLAVLNKTETNYTDTYNISEGAVYYYALTSLDSVFNENKSLVSSSVNATSSPCSASYDCGSWSSCSNSQKSRTCSRVCYNGGQTSYTQTSTEGCFSAGGFYISASSIEETTVYTRTIPSINPGKAADFELRNDEIPFKKIGITVRNRISNAKVTVESLENEPAGVEKPPASVYRYIEVNTEKIKEEDIQKVVIDFSVEKEWISREKIDENTVTLNRYKDNDWQKLTTYMVSENKTGFSYQAETPGFSYFAVTGEKKETKKLCIEVITPAVNPATKECFEYPTPCSVPEGWAVVEKCPEEMINVTVEKQPVSLPEKPPKRVYYYPVLAVLIVLLIYFRMPFYRKRKLKIKLRIAFKKLWRQIKKDND